MKLMNLPKFTNSAWDALFQGGWDEMPGYVWYLILSTHIGKGAQCIRNPEPISWLAQGWAHNPRWSCLPSYFFQKPPSFLWGGKSGWRNWVLKDTQEEWLPHCQETLLVDSSHGGGHSLPPRCLGKRCCRGASNLGPRHPPFPTMSFQTYASEPQGGWLLSWLSYRNASYPLCHFNHMIAGVAPSLKSRFGEEKWSSRGNILPSASVSPDDGDNDTNVCRALRVSLEWSALWLC